MEWILDSERLNFRKIIKDDSESLCTILQDEEIMYAWEHAFNNEEVWKWINENLIRYANEGFSYFAAIEKSSNNFIGVMGPLVESINGVKYTGIAYILDKRYWSKGYAVEGAKACMNYAFKTLNVKKVIAQIRPDNLTSRRVAEKLNMKIEDEYIRHYNGLDISHLIYSCIKLA